MKLLAATDCLSSNLNLLEDFSPLRTNDPFAWIPQGLYYDLFDNMNDRVVNAGSQIYPIDLVNGYTNHQFFNALDDDITNLPAYRVRLLNENANNQAVNITNLFAFYNY